MLLINATYIDKDQKIKKGNIKVLDRVIKIISDGDLCLEEYKSSEIFDCTNYILSPGLINSHYHNGSLLAKGLSKEIAINEWGGESLQGILQSTLFKYLDEDLSEDEYFTVCLKGYIELIKNGVTFVSDSGASDRSPDYLAKAMNILGIRGVVDVEDKIEEYLSENSQDILFTGHLPEEEYITDESLEQCKNVIKKHDPIMMTHCLENGWRKDLIYEKYGKSTIELFDENKLLSDKTVLFHCVELSNTDIDIIKNRATSVVHCPVSNIAGGGIANIKDCLSSGVNVSIGTDWARYDIWEAMRFAYFLLKINTQRNAFTAEDVFRMATNNGAKTFGLEDKIGAISDGYYADIVFIDKNNIKLSPLINEEGFSNVIHNIMIECREEMIKHVMVNGNWVMRDRTITQLDEKTVAMNYEVIINKVFGKYNV
ncbi:MAG: hypothetical protein K0S51_2026 [Bacillales bacterium]|jgi:5-methylthioadenosine/S-adenosylhomocysteine deaminase|nr:hypothetical protein [Bacillales bacterium]